MKRLEDPKLAENDQVDAVNLRLMAFENVTTIQFKELSQAEQLP